MTLRLNGNTSGFVEIQAPDAAGENSITLPADNGSANELLQNGGTAGELQYTSAGGGLHYDSSGRLLVGTSTSLDTGGLFQVNSNTSGIINYYEGDNVTPVRFRLTKSRGDTIAASDDDGLGEITFRGRATGNSLRTAASIIGEVDAAPGATSVPGRLVFSTTAVGGSSATPRIEINSDGALKLLADCPGIDFSAIQGAATNGTMTSETLDAYEEGTWTPTAGNNFNGITNADGSYVRVGNIVWISFQFNYTSLDSISDSTLIGGLPFAAQDANPNTGVEATGVIFGTNKLLFTYIETNNTVYFEMDRPIAGSTSTGSDFMRGSMVYRAA